MLIDKIKGTIFGGAIGDALGTVVEEMDRETVRRCYGGAVTGFVEPSVESVCSFLKKGQYSHETQIFLLALEMYVEKKKLDEVCFIDKLIEWVDNEKEHRYPAGGHLNAAISYKSGAEFNDARVRGVEVDGIIPSVASGLFRWDNSDEAYQEGTYLASLVYKDEVLIDAAGVLAVAVSSIAGERIFFETEDGKINFIELLISFSQVDIVKEYLNQVISALREDLEDMDELILRFGNGSFVLESLSLSLYIFLKWGKDFRKSLLRAVNSYGEFGGDTDAVGFLTGALSGCYNGIDAVSSEWIEKIENRNYLNLLSEKFFEKIENG